ncbi:MAG: protein translocase subunit SecF [bacterium]|nr:protein translocase subunit SecF [bacterium]MDZ4299835.1 protein translocase subunit SecF [Candidatus Sungbacteria bacterium]
MNIIGKKYLFLTISTILVVASFAAIAVWGLKLGIDFTGGSLLEVDFPQGAPTISEVRSGLQGMDLGTLTIQSSGDAQMILRFKTIDEPTHQEIVRRLAVARAPAVSAPAEKSPKTPEQLPVIERRFDTVGPTIGRELRSRSLVALAVASIAIILYIAWAFRRVSKPVSSWKYGIAAVVALLHDVVIPAGVFAVLGHVSGLEVDALFITAMLTIMGFSVHDTIVVFDRTRENLQKLKRAEAFEVTVNRSINETFARSITTSLTVLFVLGALFVFGGVTVHSFVLALLIGVAFGTYSSIFVASPLLVLWQGRARSR